MDACGKDRWLGTMETMERDIRRVPDADLWRLRTNASKSFIEYVRRTHFPSTCRLGGIARGGGMLAKHLFDPNALTLGFARRFATYKRPNLLLHDPDRLLRPVEQSRSARCSLSLPARPIPPIRRARP